MRRIVVVYIMYIFCPRLQSGFFLYVAKWNKTYELFVTYTWFSQYITQCSWAMTIRSKENIACELERFSKSFLPHRIVYHGMLFVTSKVSTSLHLGVLIAASTSVIVDVSACWLQGRCPPAWNEQNGGSSSSSNTRRANEEDKCLNRMCCVDIDIAQALKTVVKNDLMHPFMSFFL